MESYFVIHATEDGVSIEQKTKDELLKSITPNEYDDTDYGNIRDISFLEKMPTESDWNEYQHNSLLIIKGEVVVPKAKKVITEYDI